jgi:hypothetical protein
MEVAIHLPDDIAQQLHEKWGDDIPRRVLESIALEGYRSRILGESQLRRLLGFATRFDVHAFLKEHEVSLSTLEVSGSGVACFVQTLSQIERIQQETGLTNGLHLGLIEKLPPPN